MKLIIQIPCYNESKSLPITLASLPRQVPGFDCVEWLIVDDGSVDDTSKVAEQFGVDHIIRHSRNLGLARAFMTGITSSLENGADVIVNTDADNQYVADDISVLTDQILSGVAEIAIGQRPISEIQSFSRYKKILQKLGSWTVRLASGTEVQDAPSGFRAMSRNAAKRVIVYGSYSYTLESVIQAGLQGMSVASVPIRVNRELRPSRLVKSIPSYVAKSAGTIIRISIIYRPFRFFSSISLALFVLGALLGFRFLWYFLQGDGGGKIQSLILMSVLLVSSFQALLIAFVGELLAVNRRILEDIRFKISPK